MDAGALHTILADGAWTLERAEKRRKNADGACVTLGAPKAGVEHIRWECPALNGLIKFGLLKLKQRKTKERNKTACFWLAGIVPSAWPLPDTENMKAVEVRHPCEGKAKKVYIDGSATKLEASCYAGWGLWIPDNH
eukprot:16335363-Heterocapsa_arctica.AAC.1